MEKAFPHFIGVDNGHHFGRGAADVFAEADQLGMFVDASMDFVFSSHVLEHMRDMQAAVNEWGRVVKPGGYLVLYVPSANLYPKVGEPGANPDHKHDIYPGDLERLLESANDSWIVIESEERAGGEEYSLYLVARKGYGKVESPKGKTACVCRFGGFGDMLQTALVFPRLKEQGFHVTVMTTPKGKAVIERDPNVDDWYLLDQDQVPNGELFAFWKVQARRFDRFINLSESIEGTLLALPGRPNHSWPHEMRKRRLNTNYHEWTADLAQVPFKPCTLFYPTPQEQKDIVNLVPSVVSSDHFNVLWALSGSSLHKFTPHQDAVMARMLLDMPEARILLVGDDACKVLEQGWEREHRVLRLSGKLPIRHTLALAQVVDCVIGPETGVLNAVGMEKSPSKVLLLSHSSPNNLAKHWQSTQALTPVGCACYPCHMLHYSNEYCDQDEVSGAARCALNISPARIYEAVEKVYRNWQRRRK
jgi:ADP-heptose:LPS heptosyltransferase/predicted SAM-dependent methyltransferase